MRAYASNELVDVVAKLECAGLDGAAIAQRVLTDGLSGRAKEFYALCERIGTVTPDVASRVFGTSRINASNILLKMERLRVLTSNNDDGRKTYKIREVA